MKGSETRVVNHENVRFFAMMSNLIFISGSLDNEDFLEDVLDKNTS